MEPQPTTNHHQTAQDYLAFISYRHADNTEEDRQWATWLHQQLEVYDIPADLIGTTNLRGETIPERIYPVFRDEVSLPADADLSSSITQSLDRSRFLIVLCSTRAVQSHYVNQEILHFKQSGKADRIIAAMICGEPNASIDDAKQEDPEDIGTLECFPEALQYELDSDGTLDKHKRTEPIAADFRLPDGKEGATNPDIYKRQLLESGHSKADAERQAERYEEQLNNAKLKIVAGILGVRLEQLIQRDRIYQLNKARAAARRFRRIAASMAALALAATMAGGLAYQQWQRAMEERDRAETLLGQVRDNLNFMNFELRDVMKVYVPTDKRVPLMRQIDAIVESLREADRQSIDDLRQTAVSLGQKADLILANGKLDPAEALPLYQQARTITELLAQQNPENILFQRDLLILDNKLGDMQLYFGNTDAALVKYQSALKLAKTLIRKSSANPELQAHLSVSHEKLGDIQLRLGNTEAALSRYQSALRVGLEMVDKKPENVLYKRDLAASYRKLGNVQLRLGNTNEALSQYQSALRIIQMLVKKDPINTLLQRDLSVSYGKISDIQLRMGNTAAALYQYQTMLKINRTLAEIDAVNIKFQWGLAESHSKFGDVQLRLGNTKKAMFQYQSALKILQTLAEGKEPISTQLQRDLSVSYRKLGEVQLRLGNTEEAMTQHQSALKIIQALVGKDPTNTQTQRDLWIAYNQIGDTQLRLSNADTALSQYQSGLKIARSLAGKDTTNMQLQRDLSISYNNLGDVQLRRSKTEKALAQYQAGFRIVQALAEKDPKNAQFQRDVAVSYFKLANLYETRKDYSSAYAKISLAHDKFVHMQQSEIIETGDIKYIKATEKEMQRLKKLAENR